MLRGSTRPLLLSAALLLAVPAAAFAQTPQNPRIGPFVVDVRGAFQKFKPDPLTASGIDVKPASLPTHAFGLVAGAHWYPLRLGRVTFGVGGEMITSGASHTTAPSTAGGEPGPTVHTHFSSITPQISFNFGGHLGWSYVSGGIGGATLRVERADTPLPDAPKRKTINYGFGARWFASPHVAVSLDARWYAVNPQAATDTIPAQPRATLLVFSGGIAIR